MGALPAPQDATNARAMATGRWLNSLAALDIAMQMMIQRGETAAGRIHSYSICASFIASWLLSHPRPRLLVLRHAIVVAWLYDRRLFIEYMLSSGYMRIII